MQTTTRLLGLLMTAVALTTAVGAAQTPPAPPAGMPLPHVLTRPPMRMPLAPNAPLALRIAYRAIGAAEARGAGGRYLDAARSHYRAALGKASASPAAAAHEASAAAALARAALDERPLPAPRDLPTPPPMPSPLPGGGMRGAFPWPGGFGERGRFDPAALARDASLEGTPEANDLAKAALDANIAGERAVFGGNRDEGMRQHRLAHDLASAVRELASADHPQTVPRRMRMPMSAELEE